MKQEKVIQGLQKMSIYLLTRLTSFHQPNSRLMIAIDASLEQRFTAIFLRKILMTLSS